MFNLIAVICFVFGFILEVLGAKLGVFSPMAFALLGLTFLALSSVPFNIIKNRTE